MDKTDTNGACALWNGEIVNCVHQNHILKVRPCKSKILPEYARTWFNTNVGKDHFFRSAKTSSGLWTINSTELRAAPIPLNPAADREACRKAAGRNGETQSQCGGQRRSSESGRGVDDPWKKSGITMNRTGQTVRGRTLHRLLN